MKNFYLQPPTRRAPVVAKAVTEVYDIMGEKKNWLGKVRN